jgi:hypothetical protein
MTGEEVMKLALWIFFLIIAGIAVTLLVNKLNG